MKNIFSKVLMCVLSLLVIGLSSYIAYDKLFVKDVADKDVECDCDDPVLESTKDDEYAYQEPSRCIDVAYLNMIDYSNSYDLSYTLKLDDTFKQFSYKRDNLSKKVSMYLDDKLILDDNLSGIYLVSICVYDDYLITTHMWEGFGTHHIIDANGNLVREFIGEYFYRDNKLDIFSVEYDTAEQAYLRNYQLNLAKKEMIDINSKIEPIICEEISPEYAFKENDDYIKNFKDRYCYGP